MEQFLGRCRLLAVHSALFMLAGWGSAADHGRHEVHGRGSVHFARPPVRHEVVVRRVPTVRFEHHESFWRRIIHYDLEYLRLFRPGWRTVVIGPSTYYYYPALPSGCQTVVANGLTYYLCGGVYYMPYLYQGATIYVAVPPP